MTTLMHRRQTADQLRELVHGAPDEPSILSDDHRLSLSARFRAVASAQHRRIDAWMVERAGVTARHFLWTPVTARRVIGNAALRRILREPSLSLLDAVGDEIADHLARMAAGISRPGSLGHWLAGQCAAVHGLVMADALNWATNIVEATNGIDRPWTIFESDAYYDVAKARTTLRARRDVFVESDQTRIIVRFRAGSPGKSAGPGLRADLTIDALADPRGVAAARIIGLWPEAGVCLAVDGTMDDLRAGARDLVRTAVVQGRQKTPLAA